MTLNDSSGDDQRPRTSIEMTEDWDYLQCRHCDEKIGYPMGLYWHLMKHNIKLKRPEAVREHYVIVEPTEDKDKK